MYELRSVTRHCCRALFGETHNLIHALQQADKFSMGARICRCKLYFCCCCCCKLPWSSSFRRYKGNCSSHAEAQAGVADEAEEAMDSQSTLPAKTQSVANKVEGDVVCRGRANTQGHTAMGVDATSKLCKQ